MFKKDFIKYVKEGKYRVAGFVIKSYNDGFLLSDGTKEIRIYSKFKVSPYNFVEVFFENKEIAKAIRVNFLTPEKFFYKLLDYLYYEGDKERIIRVIKEKGEVSFKELSRRCLLKNEELQNLIKELLINSTIYEPKPLVYKLVE